MKNNNWQFTTLETSRRLKELKVPQDSLFYWSKQTGRLTLEYRNYFAVDKRKDWSAFSASELGEILPYSCLCWKLYTTESVNPDSAKVEYYECFGGVTKERFEADTLAESMGLMLIYLLENHLLSL